MERTIRFTVTGISPGLLMHNPQSMLGPKTPNIKVRHIPTPEVEAEAGAYRLDSGQLYLKAQALRSSMIDGGRGHRIGKQGAPGVLAATVFWAREFCPLYDPDSDGGILTTYEIDVQRAVVQGQGVARARPLLRRWACEVEFIYDDDFINAASIEEAFSIAGRNVGVGDYRPRCPKGKGGPYGRYTVALV